MRILALATATALTAATPLWAQDSAYDADTPVAVVNGKNITLGHMIALRERLPQQYQDLGDDVLFPGMPAGSYIKYERLSNPPATLSFTGWTGTDV